MSEATPAAPRRSLRPFSVRACVRGIAAAAFVLAGAGAAEAQTIGANSARLNGGYNAAGSLNSPVNVSTGNATTGQLFTNGVMQASAGSIFANANSVAQQSSTAGGVGGAARTTSLGPNLNVVVEGSLSQASAQISPSTNGQATTPNDLNGQIVLDGP